MDTKVDRKGNFGFETRSGPESLGRRGDLYLLAAPTTRFTDDTDGRRSNAIAGARSGEPP